MSVTSYNITKENVALYLKLSLKSSTMFCNYNEFAAIIFKVMLIFENMTNIVKFKFNIFCCKLKVIKIKQEMNKYNLKGS